jgi:hypothetical protein
MSQCLVSGKEILRKFSDCINALPLVCHAIGIVLCNQSLHFSTSLYPLLVSRWVIHRASNRTELRSLATWSRTERCLSRIVVTCPILALLLPHPALSSVGQLLSRFSNYPTQAKRRPLTIDSRKPASRRARASKFTRVRVELEIDFDPAIARFADPVAGGHER